MESVTPARGLDEKITDAMGCPKCGATFDTKAATMEHGRTAHGMDPEPSRATALACPAPA